MVKLLYSRVNKVFLNRDAVVEQLQNKDDFPFPVRNRIINFMTSLAKQKRRFNKWDFGGFIRKFSREQFYVHTYILKLHREGCYAQEANIRVWRCKVYNVT